MGEAAVPDGTAPLTHYAGLDAATRGPAPSSGEALRRARNAKRRERRQYRTLCARLGVAPGTPVTFRAFSDGVISDAEGRLVWRMSPDGPAIRFTAGGRSVVVVVPDGLVDDADVDLWAYALRRVPRLPAREEADVERLTRALLGTGE